MAVASTSGWQQGFSKNPHTIITDPLPDILYDEGFTTARNAKHPLHFSGTLGKWDDFELEVLKCYYELEELWKSTETLPCAWVDIEGDHPTDTKEEIQCGMEITISSRFEDLCLKKVSIVGQNLTKKCPGLGLDVCFGDSKIGYVDPDHSKRQKGKPMQIIV